MTDPTNEVLLWLAKEMGYKPISYTTKLFCKDISIVMFDLSGDTPESKAFLYDVEEWLSRLHELFLVYDEVWTVIRLLENRTWEQLSCCEYGTRHEAIQATVKYLYEGERHD